MAHKPHGRQVQVVRRARLQRLGGEDGARAEVRVADQLRGAPHERQKLVVVQAPHAVRARRLQPAQNLITLRLPSQDVTSTQAHGRNDWHALDERLQS